MKCFEPGGWLFPEPFKNQIHDISQADIKELLKVAEQEDVWSNNVREEVKYFDKHPSEGGPIFLNQLRIMNAGGTTVRLPFGDVITFDSKRHFFRGENQKFPASLPTLNRHIRGMNAYDQELYRAIANMRIWQFTKLIWHVNVVPYWEAKLSDVNYKALAQHYGFETHLLDLTNDFRTALFFATCSYDENNDCYKPLTKAEIERSEDTRYGMIFHSPNWMLDFMNVEPSMEWMQKHAQDKRNTPYEIDSGDLDGIAFQIGYQPFYRCHYQSGYIFPMRNEQPLQQNKKIEKLRFRQSEKLSQMVYEMMGGGEKIFPHEGITELSHILRMIKKAMRFSEDDMEGAYEEADKTVFRTKEEFENALLGTAVAGGKIEIVPEEVKYPVSQDLLNAVNDKYDNKDLLQEIGGMIHTLPECRERRRLRCIQIYGKEI